MIEEIKRVVNGLHSLDCTSFKHFSDSSLELVFGEDLINTRVGLNKFEFRPAYRFMIYARSWRLVSNDQLLLGACSSRDWDGTIELIDVYPLGCLVDIRVVSKFDLQLVFESGFSIFVFCLNDDSEELFYFRLGEVYAGFSCINGWNFSDE